MKRKNKLPLVRGRLVRSFADIALPGAIRVKASELKPLPMTRRRKAVRS
jgi:hypothetical protein